MLNNQNLPPLSPGSSQRRIDRATDILGAEVVSRILALALYLLGARRKELAEFLAIPLDTVKSLVQRVFTDGLPALEDRRGKASTFRPCTVEPKTRCKILLEQENVVLLQGSVVEFCPLPLKVLPRLFEIQPIIFCGDRNKEK